MKKLFLVIVIISAFAIGYLINNPKSELSVEGVAIEVPEITFDQETLTDKQVNDEFLPDWKIISDRGDGVVIKQDGDVIRYAFIIDHNKLNISITGVKTEQTFLDTLSDDVEPKPKCAFGGAHFEQAELHSPVIQTLPLIENGQFFHGTKTDEYPTRTLYISEGLSVDNVGSNEDIKSADFAISGLNPDYYAGQIDEPELSVIAIKDDNLILLGTTNATVDEIVSLLTENGVDENEIIVLQDSFLRFSCYDREYSWTAVMVGSGIFVTPR